MFSGEIPRDRRNPIQNWCVDQTFNTRGMPTRSFERSLADGAAESFPANHLCNAWECIFRFLHPLLNNFQLMHIFHQALRTRIADNHPFPALSERYFAPWSALSIRQFYVNKCAAAV